MENNLQPLTIETAERLDDIRASLNALELMTDAFLIGDGAYNQIETANAIHRVIDTARADIEKMKAEIKATINTSKTA